MVGTDSGIAANGILIASIIAWASAQALKVVSGLWIERKLDWAKMFGPGGMPSSHSAFVTSLATGVGIADGFGSSTFAIAAVFATIVMYDAAGVRQAVGKQAAILNQIVMEIFQEGHVHRTRLRELLGHTPYEVLAGAVLGIGLAYWWLAH